MCNFLFLAADSSRPPLLQDKNTPGAYLFEPGARSLSAIYDCFSKPQIYGVGAHMGCACPFGYEPDWEDPNETDLQEWQASREDFRQLAVYLKGTIPPSSSVELYNAWDYWKPPLIRREISVDDLLQERFVLQECEFLAVQGP